MRLIFRRLLLSFKKTTTEEKNLKEVIHRITSVRPVNIRLYILATQHASVAKSNEDGFRESNERLEYLGDAILGSVVAEFLFKKYPFKDEGFLTDIRARIVNRDSLNELARRIGLQDIIEINQVAKGTTFKSLLGDSLEALIGAIYLDRGYEFTKKFILKQLVDPYVDLQEIIKNNPNYKSKIIEWAHKENKDVKFEILDVKGSKHNREFVAQVMVNDKPLGRGSGFSKKKAEQDAAQKTCDMLNLD